MSRLGSPGRWQGPRSKRLALLATVIFLSPLARSQTTVDASQRQAKASDFTPVQLPALDPSLLQSTVSVSRPAPAKPVIELQYDPTPDFVYPHDPNLIRWITVKNDGGYVELEFKGSVNGPGGFSTPGTWHPQRPALYLQPGESQRIWVIVGWGDLDQSSWTAAGTYDYRIDLSVYAPGNGQPASTVSLHNNVHVVYTAFPPVITPGQPVGDNNAAIGGMVFDAATRKPVAHAQVQLASTTEMFGTPYMDSSGHSIAAYTDSTGHYSIAVTAYRRVPQGVWNDFGISIQAPGYAAFHTAIAPRAGDNIGLDAPMKAAVQGPAYVVQAKTDAVMNQYVGAASKDGRYVALAPFHSILNGPLSPCGAGVSDQAKLSFFTTDGALLWQFPLYAEDPAVAVSDDGSLVATARCDSSTSDTGVYVLDHNGQIVWFANLGSFFEVRFSHDNKYLAAGDLDGNLYLLDIASKKAVWQRFVNDQVRTLAFDSDNGTLNAGSGDGYLYSFRMDGTLAWRTYIGGWSTTFNMSKNYILVGGKEGYFISLLNKANGQTLWQFPLVVSGNYAVIAPDESYIAAGGSQGQGTLLLDLNGVLLDHDDGTGAAAIANGGSYMLLTSQDPSPGDTGTTWLKVMGRDGRELWNSGLLDHTVDRGPLDGFAWISDDGRKMVAANGNWVYFLTQQGPIATSLGVVSAASYSASAVNGISPGEMLTLFGQGLGPQGLTALQLDGAGRVATLLAGAEVLFDNTPAPIIYTSSGQVSVMAPYDLAGKSKVTITAQYQGLSSPPLEFAVVPANPGLFTLDSSGKGDAAIVHVDGSPVNSGNPAAAGEFVSLYAEGYGTSTPALPDGTLVAGVLPAPVASTQLLIDGQPVDMSYCGSAPYMVNGVLQVNFGVPALAAGAHQIQLTVGNRQSPTGVTLRIR
jgi:uncharacterized protein (TIGR03437 family)